MLIIRIIGKGTGTHVSSSQPESVLVDAVIRYLWHAHGAFVWRNNTGVLKDEHGRKVRFGFNGSADVIGAAPDGRFLAVECKTEVGRLSEAQERFLQRVRERGGIALVVRPADYNDLIDAALATGAAKHVQEVM